MAFNVFLGVLFAVGLSLLLYPTVSDIWNSYHQSMAIVEYSEEVESMETQDYDALRADAQAYNLGLQMDEGRFVMTSEEREVYNSLLSVSSSGVMGYLEIPELEVSLPIYHGTEESVLAAGVGHLEGSSLPVGGKGTHCVVSGHRGLPSATLLTNLDKLEEGDTFELHVLDEVLTYEVDQILTVDPYDLDALAIYPNEDYCTLVTCTPYGINSHRLLVRGHRIESFKTAEPYQGFTITAPMVAAAVGIPAAFALTAAFVMRRSRKNRREGR